MNNLRVCLLYLCISLIVGCASSQSGIVKRTCFRESITHETPIRSTITFRRNTADAKVPIVVTITSLPSSDRLYSPRGPLSRITITEGDAIFDLPRSQFPTDSHLRSLEDIWSDDITLMSKKPYAYRLTIPHGVPKGVSDIILDISNGHLKSLRDWICPDFARSQR